MPLAQEAVAEATGLCLAGPFSTTPRARPKGILTRGGARGRKESPSGRNAKYRREDGGTMNYWFVDLFE